jgi:hypothetical protein
MAKAETERKHATTRYQRISEAIIDEVQRTHRDRGDLYRIAPWLSHENKRIIVAETLDADRAVTLPLRRLMAEDGGVGPWTDFKRAVVADLLVEAPAAAGGGASGESLEARAMALLTDAAISSTASPLIEYEPLYRDLAEAALLVEEETAGREAAADWLKRVVAHNLHHHHGDDVAFALIDLASAYLQLDRLDLGLSMLTHLLQRDPGDIWIYRFMATGLGVVGLESLGSRAAARGLALVDATDDPEDLHDDFLMAEFELRTGPKGGREADVSPEILAGIEAALSVGFDAGHPEAPEALCEALVPGWANVPVKAALRFRDLPPELQALVSSGDKTDAAS